MEKKYFVKFHHLKPIWASLRRVRPLKKYEISEKITAGYYGMFTHHYTPNYIIWPKEIEIERI